MFSNRMKFRAKSHPLRFRCFDGSSVTSERLQARELVVQHVLGLEDSEFISASSVALSQDLLEAVAKSRPNPALRRRDLMLTLKFNSNSGKVQKQV